jgi:glutaconate CoA-transferase subunit A
MLIGAGCVDRITGAWVGNVSGGLGHNYRRAAEHSEPKAIEVIDHSNFSLGMALLAGAHGLPYIPTRTILGSDILRTNKRLKVAENPFSETPEPVVLVPPLRPDVAVLSVPRADRLGNAHFWGSSGLAKEAALAAERLLIVTDELVEPAVIASDPSRVIVPGFLTTAVCHLPAAQHPSPMTGRWRRDTEFFSDYHRRSRTRDGFLQWLDEWVLAIADHEAYRSKLGNRLNELRIVDEAPSVPASYGAW